MEVHKEPGGQKMKGGQRWIERRTKRLQRIHPCLFCGEHDLQDEEIFPCLWLGAGAEEFPTHYSEVLIGCQPNLPDPGTSFVFLRCAGTAAVVVQWTVIIAQGGGLNKKCIYTHTHTYAERYTTTKSQKRNERFLHGAAKE